MPEKSKASDKSKAPKKKAAKPAVAKSATPKPAAPKPAAPKAAAKSTATPVAPRGAKARPAAGEEGFFVVAPQLTVVLARTRPNGAAESTSHSTFGEARRAAIDALVDAIEEAEALLDALKQASDYDDLS